MLIFLVGFMGSGKSHWGKIWSTHYQFQFIDLDEVIEKKAGATIPQIFTHKGEEYFRAQEHTALKTVCNGKNIIVATGGGTPAFFNNMAVMQQCGITIYLQATIPQIITNLQHEQQQRPLIAGLNEQQLQQKITDLLNQRKSFYELATYTLPTENLAIESLDTIMNLNTKHA